MKKSRREKNIIIALLLVSVGALSIVYASVSATLSILGTTNMMDAKWDVGFTSVNVDNNSTIASNPVITNENISYEISMKQNSNYEFDAVITNSGTYDAKLKKLTVSDVPSELEGILTYQVTGIVEGSIISHEASSNTATVHVKVNMGSLDTAEKVALVESIKKVTLTINAEYEQV